MASKIFFSHQKVYFWISAFDHRAIVVPKMHIVQCCLIWVDLKVIIIKMFIRFRHGLTFKVTKMLYMNNRQSIPKAKHVLGVHEF